LVQTSLNVNIGDNVYQTIQIGLAFNDSRTFSNGAITGGQLSCTISQTDGSGTATQQTLVWNISTDLLYISFNVNAQLCTIATADKITFASTNEPLNMYNNFIDDDGYFDSATLYMPVAVMHPNVPPITTTST
jgi:hypothetical protein